MTFLRNLAIAGTAACAIAAPASAATLDNFNRADAGTLGDGWTQVEGSAGIVGNQATGSGLALATYNSASGNTVSFNIFNTGDAIQYGAAVIGWGSAHNYFVKVQNNGGASGFNTYGFYTGNNGGGQFGSLSALFESAHVVVSVVGSFATLTITPNVGAEQVYTYDYGIAFSGGDIGLGFYGPARIDDFGGDRLAAAPEPATWAMLIAGFGLAGAALRRRSHAAVAA